MSTQVPGLKAKHKIVTLKCRDLHGKLGAFTRAVDETWREYMDLTLEEVNHGADFHLVLTVERQDL